MNTPHTIRRVPETPAAGSAQFYQFDGSSNTVAVTGAGGALLNSYSYLPFGEKAATESVANPFTYVGQAGISDDGNGLYYMRARYYAPSIGRFISQDPIRFRGGVNFYAYVHNGAVSLIDPLGLCEYGYSTHGPDFVQTNFGVGPFGCSVTIDRYGRSYLHCGGGLGTKGFGINDVVGVVNQYPIPTPDQLANVLGGAGVQACVGAGGAICVGGNGSGSTTALGIGVGATLSGSLQIAGQKPPQSTAPAFGGGGVDAF